MATEQVELASVPYVTFVANKKQSGEPASYSFVLRGYVRHWLDNVWAEYDRISLTDMVGESTWCYRSEGAGPRLGDPSPTAGCRMNRAMARAQSGPDQTIQRESRRDDHIKSSALAR